MSWFAFFLCFFAWFGIAPLMKVVREEMALTKEQIGWCIIGSVAITVIARLAIGVLCDKIGPRLAYTWLLILGSLPVMGIGFAQDYTSFLLFPHRDWCHWSVIRHHAVPHLDHVCPQLCRHGQCNVCRLGQPGRWRDAIGDAPDLRVLCQCARGLGRHGLASGHGCGRSSLSVDWCGVLLPDAGCAGRQLLRSASRGKAA